MIKQLSTASAVALALAAGPAMADGLLGISGGADLKIGVNADASLGKQFKMLDKDGDGVITKSEAEASAELASDFNAMDDDNSGGLTQGEFSSGLKARADAAKQSAGDKMRSTMESGKDMAGSAAAKTQAGMKAGAEASSEAAQNAAAKAKASGAAPSASAEQATPAASGERKTERVKMTRLRQTIAKRLKSAQDTAALLTTFNDVDMTAVIEAREKYKDLFAKKHGIKLGFMSFFAKASVLALKDVPAANAQIDGDEIVYHDYVDISVAVSAPNGLVVPVVRQMASSFRWCAIVRTKALRRSRKTSPTSANAPRKAR